MPAVILTNSGSEHRKAVVMLEADTFVSQFYPFWKQEVVFSRRLMVIWEKQKEKARGEKREGKRRGKAAELGRGECWV